MRNNDIRQLLSFGVILFLGLVGGCRNDQKNDPISIVAIEKQTMAFSIASETKASGSQVNLVADNASFGAMRVDANLVNAWGIAINPNGIVWISTNHTGESVVYDKNGNQLRAPVTIPAADSGGTGSPTGIVFNPTTGFVIPSTGATAKFIFASEDGLITAWGGGASAAIVANRSADNRVYKGLAMAMADGRAFLYATNFHGNTIDVYDDHFQSDTTMSFKDASIPAGFAPFNIQNIDDMLYVTYAKQLLPDSMDDQAGPGNGYIDVFTTRGKLVGRFASQGSLNSPWGLAEVSDHRLGGPEDAILVGNFGDGKISVFSKNGKFRGQLGDTSGAPVVIPGLWALVVTPSPNSGDGNHEGGKFGHASASSATDSLSRLFFSAGPNGEDDGLFGYLQLQHRKAKGHDDGDGDGNGEDGHGEDSTHDGHDGHH